MDQSQEALNKLLQQLSSLGIVGPQAEATAKSLITLRNASESLVDARNAELNAISGSAVQHQNLSSKVKTTSERIESFATNLISTADAMASSNSVLTQISPMITFAGDVIEKVGSMGGELGSKLGAIAGSLGGPAAALAGSKLGEMIGGLLGNTLGKLAPVAASIFNQYLQQGEKVIQSFNTLSTVGVTFGGSLENMNRIIANTNMPLEMLAKVAQSNAENLALLGGGVSGALERVAKAARNELAPQLVTLYGGFANLSDELVDYMAMERRRGVNEDLLSDKNRASTEAYLYQLKEISALTGKNSRQIRSEIEARSRNAATQSMMMKMSADERRNFDLLMQSIPEGARTAMQDLILAQSRGLEPISKEFLELQAVAPGLTDAMRMAAGDLKKSPEEFSKTLGKTGKELAVQSGQLTDAYGDILYIRQAGRLSASVISTLDTTLTDLNANSDRLKNVANDIALFKEQTAALVANASQFTSSIRNIYAAQSNLAVTLNSLVLGDKDSAQKFTSFANVAVTATGVMEKLVKTLDDVIVKLVNFDLKNINLQPTVRQETDKLNVPSQRVRQLNQYITDLRQQEVTSGVDNSAEIEKITNELREAEANLREQQQRLNDTIDRVRRENPSKYREDTPKEDSKVTSEKKAMIMSSDFDYDKFAQALSKELQRPTDHDRELIGILSDTLAIQRKINNNLA